MNYQLRKIIKNRGYFPNDDAVIKLLWLAIRDIEDKRARARAQEKGVPREQRKAPGRLVEGAVVHGWKQALGALALAYPDRTPPRLTTPCPSSTPPIPSHRAGGVHVERPQRSEDERRVRHEVAQRK